MTEVADNETLRMLEFDKVKRSISEYILTQQGKEQLGQLHPLADLPTVQERLALVAELMQLLAEGHDSPLAAFPDPTPLLSKLTPEDAFLTPEELRSLEHFLSVILACRKFFRTHSSLVPNCYIKFNALVPFPELQKLIGDTIDEKAEIRDSASADLGRLRSRVRALEEQIHHQLEAIISSAHYATVLQDTFFTLRNNRYVLPVRSGAKNRLPGIVHGVSHTGETFFIEPFEIVELTNALTDFQAEAQREERKILTQLAASIRPHLGNLEKNLEIVTQLDLLSAIAHWADASHFEIPLVRLHSPVKVSQLHHPLLRIQKAEASVAVEVRLNPQDRTIIISGPNTGGKTTLLKTLGLSACMLQCAIPVGCSPDSSFPLFPKIFADIGDEQDVTSGLSTFSAHLRRLNRILQQSEAGALILLDELGSATEPQEGTALGIATLEFLARHNTLTFVASHLEGYKVWAHGHAHARNASFAIDPETLRPNFQLRFDVPGVSYAFAVARHQGIPEEIIKAAEQQLPEIQHQLSSLVAALEEKLSQTRQHSLLSRQTAEQAETLRKKYHQLLKDLEQKQRQFRKQTLEEKETILTEARQLVEKLIANLGSKADHEQARRILKEETKAVQQEIAGLAPAPTIRPEQLGPGTLVHLPKLRENATIKHYDVRHGRLTVVLQDKELTLPLSEIQLISPVEEPRPAKVSVPRKPDLPREIDLHGKRVEEALELLDKYLDDAFLAGHEMVKIVCGRGTGRLRLAVEEFLAHHHHVESYRPAQVHEGTPSTLIATLHSW